jgi:hypothetical protein
VTGGVGDYAPRFEDYLESGGGVVLVTSDATLRDLVVRDNHAARTGGGIAVFEGTPAFERVELSGNRAPYGAGMLVLGCDGATLDDVAFVDNDAGASGFGGGLYATHAAMTVTGAEFRGNTASAGSAMHVSFLQSAGIRIVGGTVADNGPFTSTSTVELYGGATYGTLTLQNVILADNEPAYLLVSTAEPIDLENVTAVGNRGFVQALSGGWVTVHDSIVYDNGGATSFVDLIDGRFEASYTLFDENTGSWTGTVDPVGSDGNFAADPAFTLYTSNGDPTDDDLTLSPSSPAIDAGDPDPAFDDVDGTRNDVGAFGGPSAVR